MTRFQLLLAFLLLLLVACKQSPQEKAPSAKLERSPDSERDPHSHSNPDQVKVRHLDLDLEVLFDRKSLQGSAVLEFQRSAFAGDAPLILDTYDLNITQVEMSAGDSGFTPARFERGAKDKILGAPLIIQLSPQATRVRIQYSSSPTAGALQWLAPAQTAGKKRPFLFSQSQAIYARSWIPLQDSPTVRITYNARIRLPQGLKAVMSAEGNFRVDAGKPAGNSGGSAPAAASVLTGSQEQFNFHMGQAVPSYLIALAVGDLEFKPLGKRTGVYAEPSLVHRAASEFADTERMMEVTERLYGPYRWGRYDILVLPPSFPYGGMENPRLTFATPTILAGDKSLVALVAHELAHSWSGNLVTNATWNDFWLNEGFTTYVHNRIVEAVYGADRARMEAVLEWQELQEALRTKPEADQRLRLDLKGRDPEEGVTEIPYVKGASFLRHLEQAYGRERFDSFLRGYFDHFAFQSISTTRFLEYLDQNLVRKEAGQIKALVPIAEWVYQPGIPANAPVPESDAFAKVEAQARAWLAGASPASKLPASAWSFQEWLHFLRFLPVDLSLERMRELDQTFRLTRSGNSEIVHQWLLVAIRRQYTPAYSRLEDFLLSVGRRKFLRPLYAELVKTPSGRERALAIYRKARPGYHPIAVATIDAIVGWK